MQYGRLRENGVILKTQKGRDSFAFIDFLDSAPAQVKTPAASRQPASQPAGLHGSMPVHSSGSRLRATPERAAAMPAVPGTVCQEDASVSYQCACQWSGPLLLVSQSPSL